MAVTVVVPNSWLGLFLKWAVDLFKTGLRHKVPVEVRMAQNGRTVLGCALDGFRWG